MYAGYICIHLDTICSSKLEVLNMMSKVPGILAEPWSRMHCSHSRQSVIRVRSVAKSHQNGMSTHVDITLSISSHHLLVWLSWLLIAVIASCRNTLGNLCIAKGVPVRVYRAGKGLLQHQVIKYPQGATANIDGVPARTCLSTSLFPGQRIEPLIIVPSIVPSVSLMLMESMI